MRSKILLDFILNFISFFLLIGSQQLILLPYLSRVLSDEEFSVAIIIIAIANIIGVSIGTGMSNMKHIKYRNRNSSSLESKSFFGIIALVASLISFLIYFLLFSSHSIIDNLMIFFIILFTIFRLYLTAENRFSKKYRIILISHVLYCLVVITMIFYEKYLLELVYFKWFFILIISEILCIFILMGGRTRESEIVNRDSFKETLHSFVPFSVNESVMSFTSYVDRFILYPYVTPNQLNSYFSASSVAKFALMLINPISNVILSWLNQSEDEIKNRKEKSVLLLSAILIFIISIPLLYLLTPIFVRILYPDFYLLSLDLIPYIALINGLALVTSIINPYNLKNGKIKIIYRINIAYLLTFSFVGLWTIAQFTLIDFLLVSLLLKSCQTVLYFYIFFSKKIYIE